MLGLKEQILYLISLALAGGIFFLLYVFFIKDEITLAICFGLCGAIGVAFPQTYLKIKEKYFDE
ncbi:MAG: hypothetical protein AB7V50_04470 [Vampirovibrionia bacterium]